MTLNFARGLAAALALAAATSAQAQQTSNNQVAAKTDWSVFEDKDPKECWAVSTPSEPSVYTRDGRNVSVKRSVPTLYTFYRPNSDVFGQVTFYGGYPFASGSTVNLNIGGEQFELFVEGEWAWPQNPAEDSKIIASMKRGATATLTARSGRGTQTKDTFSLSGYTAAVEEAAKRCK